MGAHSENNGFDTDFTTFDIFRFVEHAALLPCMQGCEVGVGVGRSRQFSWAQEACSSWGAEV